MSSNCRHCFFKIKALVERHQRIINHDRRSLKWYIERCVGRSLEAARPAISSQTHQRPADSGLEVMMRRLAALFLLTLLGACSTVDDLSPSSSPTVAVRAPRFADSKPHEWDSGAPWTYAVHGTDVSKYQTSVDWPTARASGISFAFIKATEGGDHTDPMFMANWNAAKAAGVKRGAYHFIYWCRVASEQADWFIRNVPKDPDALPPVIDVEYNGESSCRFRLTPQQTREKMKVFMDRLERHYGKRPIIYATPDFYEDNLRGYFRDYPFWLRSVAAHPAVRYPEREWLFWQYSGTGLSQGANGKIELNVFYGSENDWQRWINGKARWDQVAGLR
eukprot:gene40775-55119_t